MSKNKNSYEISLWHEVVGGIEEKIAILGSSESEFEGRARNCKFKVNINGTHELSFELPKSYIDYSTQSFVSNSIINEIWNESKIKLRRNDKWFEFLVKDIQEVRKGKQLTYHYVCADSYITELSSQGYSLIFEEESGMGTINELGHKVFDNSGWIYLDASNNSFKEKIKEYVYEDGKIKIDPLTNLPLEKEVEKNMPVIKYEPSLERYVTEYSKPGDDTQYWGYATTETITVEAVRNYITNSKNFIDTIGWESTYVDTKPTAIFTTKMVEKDGKKYYCLDCNLNQGFNTGIVKNSTTSANYKFEIGKIYAFRAVYSGANLLNGYVESDKDKTKKHLFSNITSDEYCILKPRETYEGFSLALEFSEPFLLESVEFFEVKAREPEKQEIVDSWADLQKVSKENFSNNCLLADSTNIPQVYKEEKIYYFYYSDKELIYVDGSGMEVVLRDGQKVRTLIAEKSNRFNLSQDLAELFEGWPRFTIEHDQSGRVKWGKYDDNKNIVEALPHEEGAFPLKYVTFVEQVGKVNGIGFHYQQNLDEITRTRNSESLVTKMFVEHLEADYGENGYIAIEYADEEFNPSGENYLLNFDYFLKTGKIKVTDWFNDLYGTSSSDLAYLANLKKFNNIIDSNSDLDIEIGNTLSSLNTKKSTLELQLSTMQGQVDSLNSQIQGLITDKDKKTKEDLIAAYEGKIEALIEEIEILDTQIDAYNTQKESVMADIENAIQKKEQLNNDFNNKYTNYIREGVWQDANYVSSNEYCIDAAKTLQRSCYPEVSYTLKALNIAASEEYSDWEFSVGDYTYVTDEEIFGRNSTGMLNREPVTLSEIEYDLDSPENTLITIQNFKTQFEDLFSRMAAASQTVQFKDGIFSKAADNFTADGELQVKVLQNTLLNNSLILSAAKDQSVIIDSNGVELRDTFNNNKIVRLVNSGIFLTTDGGKTWLTGITANGINTAMLTAGQINVDKINLISYGFPTFGWTKDGISAYRINYSINNNTGEESVSVNNNQFVRYDQHGLYLTKNGTKAFSDNNGLSWWEGKTWKERLDIIENPDNTLVSLTWNGLKIGSDSGAIKLSTIDSKIGVYDNNSNERVVLGEIGTNNYITGYDEEGNSLYNSEIEYGLLIKNNEQKPVLKTDSNGELWLQSQLSIGQNYDNPYLFIRAVKEELNELVIAAGPESGEPSVFSGYTFSVDGNGRLTANDAIIRGTIFAKSGAFSGDINANNGIIREKITIGGSGEWDENNNWISTSGTAYISGNLNDKAIKVGDNFYVEHNGVLYAEGANISGTITATSGSFTGKIKAESGSISGTLSLGESSNSSNQFTLNGGETQAYRILVTENDERIFSITPNGEVYAQKIVIGKDANIENYLMIGESSAWINPVTMPKSNYTFFVGYKDSSPQEASTFSNSTHNLKTLLNGLLETIDDEESNSINKTLLSNSNFLIDATGNVTIKGSDNKIYGSLEIPTDDEYNGERQIKVGNIVLTTSKGSLGSDAEGKIYVAGKWHITDSGEAYFQEASINGDLHAVRFVYDEVATSSGTILIRPSCKIKKVKSAENYKYEIEIVESLPETKAGNYVMLQVAGQNIKGSRYYGMVEFYDSASKKVYMNELYDKDFSDITDWDFSKIELSEDDFSKLENGTYVDFGADEATGIVINAMNHDVFGQKEAITFYRNVEKQNNGKKYYDKKKSLVLGNLEDIEDVTKYLQVNEQGEFLNYGLYSDNVFLKGTMMTIDSEGTTAGITTGPTINSSGTNLEKVVFWAGNKDADYKDKTKSTFYVTDKGYVYAKNGYFEGTIVTKNAEITGRITNDGLKVDGQSLGIAFISSEGKTQNGQYQSGNISTLIDNHGLDLYSGSNLRVYDNVAFKDDVFRNEDTGESWGNKLNKKDYLSSYKPFLFTDNSLKALGVNSVLFYGAQNSDGLLINQGSISYKKRTSINENYEEDFKQLYNGADGIQLVFEEERLRVTQETKQTIITGEQLKTSYGDFNEVSVKSIDKDKPAKINLGEKVNFQVYYEDAIERGFDIYIIE